MSDLTAVVSEIVAALEKINPYRIILFGSLANSEPRSSNDIDLAVILNTETIPSTYEERAENTVLVHEAIYEFSRKYPIDLKVYTKKEFNLLIEQMNQFVSEINRGQVLFEAACSDYSTLVAKRSPI